MTGPYIVTHDIPGCGTPCGGDPECERVRLSRVAVETLQGARSWVYNAVSRVPHQPGESSEISDSIPADGGSVTLPDGSTITVKPVTRDRLIEELRAAGADQPWEKTDEALCAAFNESEEAKQ